MNNEVSTPLQEFMPPVEIPTDSLSPEALNGIIESFILREGTDYGAVEVSFERKKEQLLKQIEKNEIKIVYDPNTESVTLAAVADRADLR